MGENHVETFRESLVENELISFFNLYLLTLLHCVLHEYYQ